MPADGPHWPMSPNHRFVKDTALVAHGGQTGSNVEGALLGLHAEEKSLALAYAEDYVVVLFEMSS